MKELAKLKNGEKFKTGPDNILIWEKKGDKCQSKEGLKSVYRFPKKVYVIS